MKTTFNFLLTLMLVGLACLKSTVAAAQDPGWVLLGSINAPLPPYELYYYKILQMNATTDRYASVIELNVQANPNYYNQQGIYRIMVSKYEGLTDRFNGMEIKCIGGNPGVATFYVYNNALWVRANYGWGVIQYRNVSQAYNSPLVPTPFGQTITAPAGYIATADFSGLKCDFVNNVFYKLPATSSGGDEIISGKMGIGLTPTYQLHVSSPANPSAAAAYIWGENYGTAIGTLDTTSARYAFSVFGNSYADASVRAGGRKQLFFVRGDGNVGIGTAAPQSKLAVNGDITARKIRVTQSGWADFVFQPGYQLPSLGEVEAYINTHQHLPGIPSAAEVTKDGIDLGDMNKQLLQKIEELTLYIIELKKEMQQQHNEIKQLKATLNK